MELYPHHTGLPKRVLVYVCALCLSVCVCECLRPTGEGEQPAIDSACDGLQLHHVHGLADVHRTGHAPQRAAHKLRHLLDGEHLQQLVKDGGEGVEQGGLEFHRRGGGR